MAKKTPGNSSAQKVRVASGGNSGRRKPAVPAVKKKQVDMSSEQLVVENLKTPTTVTGEIGDTLAMLVLKVESMAHHIIALEEIVAELVADNGLDLARVNARVRLKFSRGTDGGDPSRSIDVAAAIASPLPRC